MRPPNYKPVNVQKVERPQIDARYDGIREYGRIRIYEDASLLLRNLLRVERDRIALQRRTTIESEPGASTQAFNRQIKLVDQLLDELERTRVECGWA